MNGEAGKGSVYRHVDDRKFSRNYLRIFGQECPRCYGTGNNPCTVYMDGTHLPCHYCKGLGYVERRKT
jgi:DnaJ-class molecular chaperone